jgi:SAM-dependent methyltransferase
MEKNYEVAYHDLEGQHWWFTSRRKTILNLIKDADKDSVILDVGCSSGLLLSELRDLGFKNLFGIDVSELAVETAKSKGFPNCFLMDGQNPDFSDEKFDIIVSSDSLEHMAQDKLALKNWHKLLKHGGKAIVYVPAFNSLWSEHDVVNQHYRRYTKKDLNSKMEGAGYHLEDSGYWNSLLFFPIFAVRKLGKFGPQKEIDENSHDLKETPSVINKGLKSLLAAEQKLSKVIKWPVGVSCFSIGIKL